MITDIPISNNFTTRNNWALKTLQCKKYESNVTPASSYYKLNCIVNEVLRKTKIPKETFVSKTRWRPAVEARQMYFARARHTTNASLVEIGSLVKNGDHANVLYGIKQIRTVPTLIKKYNELFN